MAFVVVNVVSLCLTDAMASILGLLVVERIEVDVVHDDHIGCHQVDAHASGLGGQHEDENLIVVVVQVDEILALGDGRGAVESHELVALELEKLLDNVEHDYELTEDEHTIALLFLLLEYRAEHTELARRHECRTVQSKVLQALFSNKQTNIHFLLCVLASIKMVQNEIVFRCSLFTS